MDEDDSSYEYSVSFDSLVSGSSKNVKSVVTDLKSHNASISTRIGSVDMDCLSPLSTDRSHRWTSSQSSVDRRLSQSMLRFSRHFSESEKYSTDFMSSGTDLNPYYSSSFESSLGGTVDEDDDVTVCSAASNTDTDTRTCSSVSQELSIKWKNKNDVEELSSRSQSSCSIIRYI